METNKRPRRISYHIDSITEKYSTHEIDIHYAFKAIVANTQTEFPWLLLDGLLCMEKWSGIIWKH